MLSSFYNLPPVAVSTEEQHFVFSSLQCTLHFLNTGGEAKILNAAGSLHILACVHPESGPCKEETAIMNVTGFFGSMGVSVHNDIFIPEKK